MLRIENFTKAYTPGKPAVKDLTLTIENGDIFGFIGHNGAGKTTTIKAITARTRLPSKSKSPICPTIPICMKA